MLYEVITPVNEQAANLIHLKTSFEFEMGNNVTDIGNLVAALHPTVITSYSIHYTKLYDTPRASCDCA